LVPTIQRLAILEYLEGTRSHPTADEVHTAVAERFPSISRATVYNTLEALSRAGAIVQLTVDRSATRYDADLSPHVHFRCRLCGRVYDIPVESENRLGAEVAGHRVESVRTYAYGVCSSCLANRSDAGKEASDA
jgi:Fe2+ or Zn2+ uptake regulation protein